MIERQANETRPPARKKEYRKVRVRDLEGTEHVMDQRDAMDMVQHMGWEFVRKKIVDRTAFVPEETEDNLPE